MSKIDIIYRKAPPVSEPFARYPGFIPAVLTLKAGTVLKRGYKPLACDILCELDAAVTVRDGTTLYMDLYRPLGNEKVPAILNSTTFGKRKIRLDGAFPIFEPEPIPEESFPGVPRYLTSGLETFEGSDPGYWVSKGYAVCNLDIRGCYMSGGKGQYFGTQEAEDDYDVIEWLSAQDWCNGAVTMTGNSWLGINQWFAAAIRPAHLVCIAPWEGWHDMYRDEYMVGGVPNYPGFRYNNSYSDTEEMEDVVANCLAHPLFDDYWADKRAKAENIAIPIYATASFDSLVHPQGTFMAWRKAASREKWLRVHNTQEWGDTYRNADDLLRFFDFYMKDKTDNGWEKTPKVRLSVLDPGGEDIVERPEADFPLARQQLRALYLDASDMRLGWEQPASEAAVSYSGHNGKDVVKFRYTFDAETEIVGYIGVKLWVESDGCNDLDLFVKVSKLDADWNPKFHYPIPTNREIHGGGYSGPTSRMRVSLRKLDPEKSTENEPYHPFDEAQKLRPHEIVPVEIGLFPTGLRFHAGETFELSVAGHRLSPLPGDETFVKMGLVNNGNHVVHTGGRYDSKLIIPFIPIAE